MEIENIETHVHDVLGMMEAANGTYTRESLRAAIIEKFGEEMRFHSCSESGLDAAEVVEFLEARGKFKGADDAFSFDTTQRCDH